MYGVPQHTKLIVALALEQIYELEGGGLTISALFLPKIKNDMRRNANGMTTKEGGGGGGRKSVSGISGSWCIPIFSPDFLKFAPISRGGKEEMSIYFHIVIFPISQSLDSNKKRFAQM